jgi:Formamidopyrimidine-DNA glycosylase H2TH domain
VTCDRSVQVELRSLALRIYRFGKVILSSDPLSKEPINKLGEDAFRALPEPQAFGSLMLKQRRPIKAVLLDQSVLCGIGNWVADEVLYQSQIYPGELGCDLNESQLLSLHNTIQFVLAKAVAVDADAERLPHDWLFHYRCASCAGDVDTRHIGTPTHTVCLYAGGQERQRLQMHMAMSSNSPLLAAVPLRMCKSCNPRIVPQGNRNKLRRLQLRRENISRSRMAPTTVQVVQRLHAVVVMSRRQKGQRKPVP